MTGTYWREMRAAQLTCTRGGRAAPLAAVALQGRGADSGDNSRDDEVLHDESVKPMLQVCT